MDLSHGEGRGCYALGTEANGDAIAVDPGDE